MNIYGTPVGVVALSDAVTASGLSEDDFLEALAGNGKSTVVISNNKLGVRPADLDEIEGAHPPAWRSTRHLHSICALMIRRRGSSTDTRQHSPSAAHPC